jgi:transcriptional regulator with XRE-family HTH domain
MSICQRLRQKRREFRLRQEDVARQLGFISKNGYWSIENGRTKLRAEHLCLLMRLYNVPAEFFLRDDDEM